MRPSRKTFAPPCRIHQSPCGGLRYVSPWAWRAEVNDVSGVVTVIPPVGAAIYFNIQSDRMTAIPAGVSGHRDYRIQFLNTALSPCSLENASLISFVSADGSKVRFSIASGDVVGMTSSSGKLISAEERQNQVICQYDDEHYLRSCYSPTEGLMQTRTADDGAFVMEWYAPAAVTALGNGEYQTTGKPYKTSSYSVTEENGVKTVTMTRQQGELPPYTITRIEQGNLVTIIKGTGDETIIRTIETNQLYGNMSEIIESVRGINDVDPVSCTRELKQNVNGTWLLISRTEAFNTEIAQTTTYEYNANLRIEKVTYHSGNYVEYEYDSMGRVTKQTRPWGDGGKNMTRNVYATNSSRFYDTRPIKVYTDYEMADGTFLNLAVTDYTYEDSAEVERITATTYAAGVNHQQVTIDETYGEAAAYAYAAGKPKFSHAVNGVQTWHDYEATSEHNAAHKHTVTTKANGELVAAQSRKTETFIASDDTATFEQEFIWDGTNWLLLNTTAYEYDEEKRVIKTTRGNGRISTTEWMCCGKFTETNEDGITTSYGYNSAQQLVETIRSEVKDGEVVVTPETITSYTRDAAGRALAVRRDIGAMTTVESLEYDLLGRATRQTDVLGRVSTMEYGVDGLTVTVTTPAGATSITRLNPDGSTKEVSGTMQRATQYSYDINGKNIATTALLTGNTILRQNIINGFGQTVVQTTPATNNRFIYTRSEYNAKGQMVKQYQDTGWNTTPTAPTLFEYDLFGNMVKQTTALCDTPTSANSPMVDLSFTLEALDDGIYYVTTQTNYSASGIPFSRVRKQLISHHSKTLNKSIVVDARGNVSIGWTIFENNAKTKSYTISPTANITATTTIVDGFTLSHTNNKGITTTSNRSYTVSGVIYEYTDGRGNTSTTVSDIAERPISETNASGDTTTTVYDAVHDQPSVITDALGNTYCYKYDIKGQKIAEWGTAITPACFHYNENGKMIALRTLRAGEENFNGDPSNRSDLDIKTWTFHPTTGLELRKAYADNLTIEKTYDAYNRLATETDSQGNVKVYSYEHARGLLLSKNYSDGTTTQQFKYNHLGQITQIVDDSGTHTFDYNNYGEEETDSLLADGVTHIITEKRDSYGRSIGYFYAKNQVNQQEVNVSYCADGRIATVGFVHEGLEKQFSYEYLPGSDLLRKLSMPNNMTLTQSYEENRDLLTSMQYHRGSSLVSQRNYSFDALARPLTRNTARQGTVDEDSFSYNSRSELVEAQVNGKKYEYSYDNIGNRTSTLKKSTDEISHIEYTTNELNQYIAVQESEEAVFSPLFDTEGNQTLIKSETGTWKVNYNAENRPVRFTQANGNIIIECTYDSLGRRATKKVTTNDTVTLHQRYIYRGYQQIACCDLTRSNQPALWYITWEPTRTIDSKPLAIQKDGTWYTYGLDLTKNICEVYRNNGYIGTTYRYTPYGVAFTNGNIKQPIQWSSEFFDDELALVYYNYRHYNPKYGNWISRDFYTERQKYTPYSYVGNKPIFIRDYLGLLPGIGNEDFNLDSTTCSLNLTLHISFNFVTKATYYWRGESGEQGKYPYTGTEWTEARKIKYKSNFLNLINQKWNAGYKAQLVDNQGKPCCQCANDCKNGIEFTLEAVEDTWYTCTEIRVTAPSYAAEPDPGHPFSEYRSHGGSGHIQMAEGTEDDSRVVNHEVGHNFNLDHPGRDRLGTTENETSEYEYKGKDKKGNDVDGTIDLMGLGNELRGFYFNMWVNYLNNKTLTSCAKKHGCLYKIV